MYNYVAANPINYIDPWGLFRWDTFWWGVSELGGGILQIVVIGSFVQLPGAGFVIGAMAQTATTEACFAMGIGLVDIIGAFLDDDPFALQLSSIGPIFFPYDPKDRKYRPYEAFPLPYWADRA